MNEDRLLKTYLVELEQAYRVGNATEHTYRSYLKTLLQDLAPGVTATNEPKRVACGAPDYVITRDDPSGPRTIGYIEAKDIGISLDETLRTDQLKRYRDALDNLILTDYLEFRWFVRRDGQIEHRGTARIASVGAGRKLVWDAAGAARVAEMLVAMLGQKAPDITSPDDLARRMARMAHMIRNVALDTLRSSDSDVKSAREALAGLYEAFTTTLIPDLTDEAFADMFAQTLAYGLFAARYNHTAARPFNRRDAAREIPHSNPFLRRLFASIEGPDLGDAPYVGFVDDLARLLAGADMEAILRDFGKRTRIEDPIVHFYEPFLQAYDPKLREVRGVYYTPDPVVSYITRSVEVLLNGDFGIESGLADERVVTLDPACGTGTFISSVISLIRERFRAAHNTGAWPNYVRERLLPRVFGFELLMAPYAMSHLRLGMQLAGLDLPESERKGWDAQTGENDRLGVYLTNTLEEAVVRSTLLMGRYLSDEANAASRVKRDVPVVVVLGNPPYSGHSANNGEWIAALLRGEDLTNTQGEKLLDRGKGMKTDNYFMVDGKPLGERNSKWLNDDYVKFIRFAQWRIERTGYGVLAFITNHGYLDNPTFRGMRQSLMHTFDEIHVLDLHGNSKKKERTPEGGKDENVFDIQQGVAIGLFVRRRGAATSDRHTVVHHAHLYGERAFKYDWLASHDVNSTDWHEVTPTSPMYFFIQRDERLAEEYEAGWSLPTIAPVNVLGFQTHRDHFAIDFDDEALRKRIIEMCSEAISDVAYAEKYGLTDTDAWQLATARKRLRADKDWETHFARCLYRPFDWRPSYYSDVTMDRPRKELQQHMLQPNISLNVTRQTKLEHWGNAVVANAPTPALYTEIKDGSNAFPLYLYPERSDTAKPKQQSFGDDEAPSTSPGGRRPNLTPEFILSFAWRLGLEWIPDGKGDRVRTFGPEDVFSYTYAVLHSPTYRERYADFLKSDFPRIPLTRDVELFRDLCALGDQLVGDHLLERALPTAVGYPVGGDDRVETVRYLEPDPVQGRAGRVYINRDQYFDGVPPEVWEFHVGGYRVAEKWLKDRKGRTLSYGDVEHYEKTVAALADTISLMEQIDDVIEEHGGWPLDGETVSSDVSA